MDKVFCQRCHKEFSLKPYEEGDFCLKDCIICSHCGVPLMITSAERIRARSFKGASLIYKEKW